MNTIVTDDDLDEKPLDPEVEKVRRKMMRLLVVSIGIMMAGLMAVLFAIVYKTSGGGTTEETVPAVAFPVDGPAVAGNIALPAGARIIAHSLSGTRIALRVALTGGAERIYLYDLAAGRVIGTYDITSE